MMDPDDSSDGGEPTAPAAPDVLDKRDRYLEYGTQSTALAHDSAHDHDRMMATGFAGMCDGSGFESKHFKDIRQSGAAVHGRDIAHKHRRMCAHVEMWEHIEDIARVLPRPPGQLFRRLRLQQLDELARAHGLTFVEYPMRTTDARPGKGAKIAALLRAGVIPPNRNQVLLRLAGLSDTHTGSVVTPAPDSDSR